MQPSRKYYRSITTVFHMVGIAGHLIIVCHIFPLFWQNMLKNSLNFKEIECIFSIFWKLIYWVKFMKHIVCKNKDRQVWNHMSATGPKFSVERQW